MSRLSYILPCPQITNPFALCRCGDCGPPETKRLTLRRVGRPWMRPATVRETLNPSLGKVYFAGALTMTKVGTSTNPGTRLRDIRRAPYLRRWLDPVQMLEVFVPLGRFDAKSLEARLHHELFKHRITGEWFAVETETLTSHLRERGHIEGDAS